MSDGEIDEQSPESAKGGGGGGGGDGGGGGRAAPSAVAAAAADPEEARPQSPPAAALWTAQMDAWLGPFPHPAHTYHTAVTGAERGGGRAAVAAATGAVAVALRVEAAVGAAAPFRGAYRVVARRLYAALRGGARLRAAVVGGVLDPEELVHMSDAQLAAWQ